MPKDKPLVRQAIAFEWPVTALTKLTSRLTRFSPMFSEPRLSRSRHCQAADERVAIAAKRANCIPETSIARIQPLQNRRGGIHSGYPFFFKRRLKPTSQVQ